MYKTDLTVHKADNDYIDQNATTTSFASIQKASPRWMEDDNTSTLLSRERGMKTPEIQKKALERFANNS